MITKKARSKMSDIPKIGCVNHDCNRCKAAAELRRLEAEVQALRGAVPAEKLKYVIEWLEAGCHPKHAALELRMLAAAPQPAQGEKQ
jgi:hypothetical protein